MTFVRQLPSKPLVPGTQSFLKLHQNQLDAIALKHFFYVQFLQFSRQRGGGEVHSTAKLVLLCASGKGGAAEPQTCGEWTGLMRGWEPCSLPGTTLKVGKSTVSVNLAYMLEAENNSGSVLWHRGSLCDVRCSEDEADGVRGEKLWRHELKSCEMRLSEVLSPQ